MRRRVIVPSLGQRRTSTAGLEAYATNRRRVDVSKLDTVRRVMAPSIKGGLVLGVGDHQNFAFPQLVLTVYGGDETRATYIRWKCWVQRSDHWLCALFTRY
jgi:hypothetical protein